MSLTLHVDTERWRDHIFSFVKDNHDVVPVVKGNGYGFGNTVLGAAAVTLGVDTLAVGTYEEVPALQRVFDRDLVVMTPWRPWMLARLQDPGVIHTVSRLADLRELAAAPERPRVVVEVMTSMRRHGLPVQDLPAAAKLLGALRFEGWTMHFPLTTNTFPEAKTLAAAALSAREDRLWVSHVPSSRVPELGADVRQRVGTRLWLGDRGAMRARGRVLDVHELERGMAYGYRGRKAHGKVALVVVSGGTAHGIALEAPPSTWTPRQRAASLAKGGLEAAGRSLSPFYVGGKQRWFAEPPHMQASLILVPPGVDAPKVGDQLDVDVRYTTTTFDHIAWN